MKIEPKNLCPLNNFEPCKQLDCAWFLKISGTNPNTGQPVDEWGCSIAWMPIIMLEGNQQQRQTGAAVESFRNEMVDSNKVSQAVLMAAAQANNRPQGQIFIKESDNEALDHRTRQDGGN